MPRFSMIPLFHQPIDLDRFNDLFESALRNCRKRPSPSVFRSALLASVPRSKAKQSIGRRMTPFHF